MEGYPSINQVVGKGHRPKETVAQIGGCHMSWPSNRSEKHVQNQRIGDLPETVRHQTEMVTVW